MVANEDPHVRLFELRWEQDLPEDTDKTRNRIFIVLSRAFDSHCVQTVILGTEFSHPSQRLNNIMIT